MQKNMVYIGVGIVALIIFLAVFGLNFVINASVWIGNLVSGDKQQTETTSEQFFGTLFVDSLPSATNSAEIIITGSQSDFDTVAFYINDKKVKEIDVTDKENFSEKIGPLNTGDNSVYVEARAPKAKQTKQSDTFTLAYKNKKPKLEIAEPSNDATVSNNEVTVKGVTDDEVNIEVDGAPVVVDAQGNFQESVRLKEGENMLVITALDDAGNESKVELKVTYKKDE